MNAPVILGKPSITVACVECGKVFTTDTRTQKTCGNACRQMRIKRLADKRRGKA